MANRSPGELSEQEQANRDKLLAAEAVALLLLRRRRDEAVRAGLRAGLSVEGIAAKVEASWRDGIATSRQLSRVAGLSRLEAEAASVGFSLAGRAAVATEEVRRDLARARLFARSYAQRWLRKAEGETIAHAAKTASAATLGSVRRTATTESAEAFNSGRAKYLKSASRRQLLRIWDATLDRRTCPYCARADGAIVGADEAFSDGEPGTVHPNCQCSWSLLTASEAQDENLLLIQAA